MAQTPVKKRVWGSAIAKLDEFGLDNVCSAILSAKTMTQISAELDIDIAQLITWIDKDPQRSARVRDCRARSAQQWEEKAELLIFAASDAFELAKAKELAHHYRWRAKAIAPRDYGDKVQQEHVGKDGGPIQLAAVDMRKLSDEDINQMEQLMIKAQGEDGAV